MQQNVAYCLAGFRATRFTGEHSSMSTLFQQVLDIERVGTLAGALDTRYVDLARTMATEVEGAALRVVPGAGHAAHFEQPDAFSEAAAEFLTRCLRSERVEA